jgi:hypothetical protein
MNNKSEKADKSGEEGEDKEGEKQNPWAYYYLRYFVGAVVGAGLLMAVLREAHSNNVLPAMLPEGSPKDWLSNPSVVTALGTAGLAYCYVAVATREYKRPDPITSADLGPH